jgi:AP-3 complex subunit delta
MPTLTTAYRLEVSSRIIDMCSKEMYQNVDDFDWYLSVLVDLAYVSGVDISGPLREQLVDVTARVQACRSYGVKLMTKILDDDSLLLNASDPSKSPGILWAAAWICGEYARQISYNLSFYMVVTSFQ